MGMDVVMPAWRCFQVYMACLVRKCGEVGVLGCGDKPGGGREGIFRAPRAYLVTAKKVLGFK